MNNIFIICNKNVEIERFVNMDKQLKKAKIENVEYYCKNWFSNISDDITYEDNKFTNLNKGEICILLNHLEIFTKIKEKYNSGNFLILESDAYVFPGMKFSTKRLEELINISNKIEEWDIISIGGSCVDILGQPKTQKIVIDNFSFYNEKRLIGIEGLIWNYKSICKFLDLLKDYNIKRNNIICDPIDVIIDNLIRENFLNCYWLVPCMLKQGSNCIWKSWLR